jgi:adenylylsulfate kinase-like enzyme
MIDAGVIVLAAFVSPYRTDRENIRKIVGADNFLEIYVSTPIAECERRDIKGLYAKAREGHIENFTGISAPYEAPMEADVEIDTSMISVEEAVALILDRIENKIRL